MPGSINMRLSREDENMFHQCREKLTQTVRPSQVPAGIQGWAVRLGTRVGVPGRQLPWIPSHRLSLRIPSGKDAIG